MMNLWVATVAGGVALAGSTPFIDRVFLIPALIVFALTVPIGIKAAFESLHNPEVAEFQRRFGVGSLPFLRRTERDEETARTVAAERVDAVSRTRKRVLVSIAFVTALIVVGCSGSELRTPEDLVEALEDDGIQCEDPTPQPKRGLIACNKDPIRGDRTFIIEVFEDDAAMHASLKEKTEDHRKIDALGNEGSMEIEQDRLFLVRGDGWIITATDHMAHDIADALDAEELICVEGCREREASSSDALAAPAARAVNGLRAPREGWLWRLQV